MTGAVIDGVCESVTHFLFSYDWFVVAQATFHESKVLKMFYEDTLKLVVRLLTTLVSGLISEYI